MSIAVDLDDVRSRWDTLHATRMGKYLFKREYAFIRDAIKDSFHVDKILEIGAGSGRLTLPMVWEGLDVVALDRDEAGLTLLHHRAATTPLVRGNGLALPFADASVSCVVAVQCFDYLDRDQFFNEVWRVLSDDGLFIFDTQNKHSYKWLLKPFVGRASRETSANLSWGDVRRSLLEHHFAIQATRGFSWIPFKRESDSAMIEIASRFERLLALDRCYAVSPKVLVAATKCR